MPQPTAGDVHVNRPLTNISIAFIQNTDVYIASKVFPNIGVARQSDLYFVYDKNSWLRSDAEKRAPGTPSAGSGWDLATQSYFADVFAIHKDVDDQVRANQDSPLMLDRDSTMYVTQQCMMKKEKEFVAAFMQTSVWTTDRTGVPAGPTGLQFIQWDQATSDPLTDVHLDIVRVARLTGFKPNKLVVGAEVWNALLDNAAVLARINGGALPGNPALVTEALLAQAFGLTEVLVAWATEDTAAEGATESMAFITGKTALLVYAAPSPSLMMPSAGYTFSWTGMPGAPPGGIGARIKSYRLERNESDRIEAEDWKDFKVIGAELGAMFLTAVA